MRIKPLQIEGAWEAEFPIWPDKRGYFREWFKKEEVLSQIAFDFEVQQANFSLSRQGVIRGIHYSLASNGQAKWVTCVSGSIVDVIVDLRTNSPTFKKVQYVELTQDNGKAVLIGPGLGHGFIAKQDNTGVAYLLNSSYNPQEEYEISPADPDLLIKWDEIKGGDFEQTISRKDSLAPSLKNQLAKNLLPKV